MYRYLKTQGSRKLFTFLSTPVILFPIVIIVEFVFKRILQHSDLKFIIKPLSICVYYPSVLIKYYNGFFLNRESVQRTRACYYCFKSLFTGTIIIYFDIIITNSTRILLFFSSSITISKYYILVRIFDISVCEINFT